MSRAWIRVHQTFTNGERCDGCHYHLRSGPAVDEPATRACDLFETLGTDPLECAGVDAESIREELQGDPSAAAEEARWRAAMRDFDARR